MNAVQSSHERLFKYLWILAAACTFAAYIARPLWPTTSLADFPWRWWAAPVCFVFLCCLSVYSIRMATPKFAVISVIALTSYFAVEAISGACAISLLSDHPPQMEKIDYLYLALLNTIVNSPAIFVFAVFQVLCLAFNQRALI